MLNTVKLKDLTGVAELEEALHVPGSQLLPEYDDLEVRISQLSKALFGIDEIDTQFSPKPTELLDPGRFGSEEILTDEGAKRKEEWEENFAFLEYEYDEEDVFWTAVGWDINDDNGEQLIIMDYVSRQIVCIVKGLHPKARLVAQGNANPNPATDEQASMLADAWGLKIALEAKQFKPRK